MHKILIFCLIEDGERWKINNVLFDSIKYRKKNNETRFTIYYIILFYLFFIR